MTNAEKIAKDTDFLAELLLNYNCDELECNEASCLIYKKFGTCFGYGEFARRSIKQYLESEADE